MKRWREGGRKEGKGDKSGKNNRLRPSVGSVNSEVWSRVRNYFFGQVQSAKRIWNSEIGYLSFPNLACTLGLFIKLEMSSIICWQTRAY